jgi:hypothetical protein
MSIYTKIFATASIFAIAASALVSPVTANAATGIVFTNKPSDTANYTVCIYKDSTAQSGAVNATSFSIPSNVSNTGDAYNVYINNSSSCFPLVNSTPVTASKFLLVNGHQTEVALANYSATLAAVASSVAYNELPKLTGITTPKGSFGDVSNVSVCQGNTGAIKVTFEDPNMNELTGTNISDTDVQSSSFDVSTKGKLTYTIFPTTSAVANTTGFDVTFTASDLFVATTGTGTTINVAPGPITPKVIRFSVVTDCTNNTPVSSVVASSSVTASSTAATTSSTAASAMAATSSKAAATVEVDAPSVGKGSATVRTGGAY